MDINEISKLINDSLKPFGEQPTVTPEIIKIIRETIVKNYGLEDTDHYTLTVMQDEEMPDKINVDIVIYPEPKELTLDFTISPNEL